MADEEGFDLTNVFTTDSDDADYEEGVYADDEKIEEEEMRPKSKKGDSSDEVDPRLLNRDPTLSEIRWYYRRTFARVLVDKPIDDAFKNGFEATSDNDSEIEEILDGPRWEGEGNGYIGAYRFAEKKARRDGFALVFVGTRERGASGIHESPVSTDVDVDKITHCKVLTIDDLTSNVPHEQIEEGTGLDSTQYKVRRTGIVVNTDPTSPEYRTPIGYVLDTNHGQFVHADRVQHLTWNPEVDGDYDAGEGVRRYSKGDSNYLGQWEGDSVLIPSYNILKGISKGNWAIMQALFRNAAHMYSVKLPPNASPDDMDHAEAATANINAKSALIWPDPEYDVQQHESGGEMEPQNHYEVLFDQVCADQEMTKSVLFGTQAGTVSGSETDIKNYFNKVERYRKNRAESKIREFATMAKRMTDTRTSEEFEVDLEIEWNPLFEVDADTRIQMLQNQTQALTTLIGNFALTPDEAREILTEEFTEIDLDDLTEDQLDELDRINLTRSGQGPSAERAESEYTEGPGDPEAEASPSASASRGGRQGGREQGQTTGSEQPQSDSIATNLERLSELHDNGHLTDDEFEAAKQAVLNDD